MTQITKDTLVNDGWNINGSDPVTPCMKFLSEDGSLRLIVHRMYNSDQFAVSFPDGSMMNFKAKDMEELQQFESMILSYEPSF